MEYYFDSISTVWMQSQEILDSFPTPELSETMARETNRYVKQSSVTQMSCSRSSASAYS